MSSDEPQTDRILDDTVRTPADELLIENDHEDWVAEYELVDVRERGVDDE